MFIFFFEKTLLTLLIVLPLLISVAFFTLSERKLMASIQRRVGPNIVGIGGLLQPISDGLKLIIKESIIPSRAHKILFIGAPGYTFFLSLIPWAIIPFSITSVFIDVRLSLLLVFACTSLGIYGVIIAGWSSNSRYAFLGSIRSAAQVISYELPLGLILSSFGLVVGSYNLIDIVKTQNNSAIWFIFPLFPYFLIFLIIILIETNRSPSDLPESESELVAGYTMDYSAIGFAMFFLGEYSNMLIMSSILVILFLGGWSFPNLFYGIKLIPNLFLFNYILLNSHIIEFATFINFYKNYFNVFFWVIYNLYLTKFILSIINLNIIINYNNLIISLNNNKLTSFTYNNLNKFPEIIFSIKIVIVSIYFIWVRATLPRMRYDFLMNLGWKKLLPFVFSFFIFLVSFLFSIEGLPI